MVMAVAATLLGVASAVVLHSAISGYAGHHPRGAVEMSLKSIAMRIAVGTASLAALVAWSIAPSGGELPVRAGPAVAVFLVVLSGGLVALPSAALQARLMGTAHSSLQLLHGTGKLIGAVALVLFMPTSVGALMGLGLGGGAVAAVALVVWSRRTEPPTEAQPRLNLARPALAMAIWSLASSVVAVSDRWVIGLYLSETDVGVYSAYYTLATGVSLGIGAPILLVSYPLAARHWHRKEFRESARTLLTGVVLLVGGSAMAAVAAMQLGDQAVRAMFGKSFTGPDTLALWTILGTTLWQLGLFAQKPAEIAGRTRRLAGAMILAAATNLAVNLVIVPLHGVVGAALATIGAYGLYASIALWADWGNTIRAAFA